MGNTTPARYTKQLGPMVTPELAAELEANAREDGVSVSTMLRGWIETRAAEESINRAAKRSRLDTRAWQANYRAALAKTTAQGAEHVRRHRDSDRAARGGGGATRHAPATGVSSTVDV